MVRTFIYSISVFCLLLAFPVAKSGAQETPMIHYSIKDGLPSGTIYSMLSDSKGFLWFATDAGVSRFDGHKFTNFTLSDGLAENEILKVAEDSKGNIWFLGLSGTLCYYHNGKFSNPSNDNVLKKAKINNTYVFFFEDKKHRLWFSSYTGYTIIDKDSVKIISGFKEQQHGEALIMNIKAGDIALLSPYIGNLNDELSGFFVYSNGKRYRYALTYKKELRSRFWYLTDGSVLFISKTGIVLQKDTAQQIILPFSEELLNSKVLGIMLSSDNRLWVETAEKGVFAFNYNDLSTAPERYLEDRGIADVMEDRENNIWISTFDDAAFMLPAGYRAVNNYYNNNNGKHSVFCVAKDKKGYIYTGHDGLTVNVIGRNKEPAKLFYQNQNRDPGINRVNRILTHGNDMWIGTDGDLVHMTMHNSYSTFSEVLQRGISNYNKKDTILPAKNIKDMAWYNNNLLVCNGGNISISDSAGGEIDLLHILSGAGKRHYCVYADKKGIIWYGISDGLYSLNGKEEISHASESKYLSGNIYDIGETSDSVLVIATYGNGVLLYKDGKILQHLTENDALTSNLCKKVFVRNNNIYVATAKGLTRISYSNHHIDSVRKFTTANGLLSNNVNDVFADDSEICIASQDGLTILNTLMPEIGISAPPIYLTSIKSRDRTLAPDSSYTFRYDQNSIQFSFTAISYRLPDGVLYQYRLTDDQKWMETKNTSIDVPYLAPGSYHFQLRAKILNGPWSNVRSFYFAIRPPFWKTIWFAMMCAFCFVVLVVLVVGLAAAARQRKDSAQLKIKDQVAYLEQQALQAMMNPHFIFNVMNSIQHYINNNEKHEANVYLADFARLIRMNLDISSKRYIPLDEEVAYLELYMTLESLRFGKNLTFGIHIDADIDGDETMVPVMLLQPFIENAIWHGILPKKESGHVQVEIRKESDGMLRITITDNGVGIPETKKPSEEGLKTHISRGMKMTRQRLDLLSKITGHTSYINIEDAFPVEQYKGTKVEFHIPGDLS
jgi:ligand-binding sensor domain-containing protein